MDEMIGIIKLFAGNFAPRGFAFCNGQLLSIAQNTALFSILGTTYGGNGQTTFALPDLRGRVPLGPGQGPGLSNYSLGQQAGTETVTLTANQLAPHTHTVKAYSDAANTGKPENNVFAGSSIYVDNQQPDVSISAATIPPSGGGSQPHENLQPYLAINFIICLEGIFPSRN